LENSKQTVSVLFLPTIFYRPVIYVKHTEETLREAGGRHRMSSFPQPVISAENEAATERIYISTVNPLCGDKTHNKQMHLKTLVLVGIRLWGLGPSRRKDEWCLRRALRHLTPAWNFWVNFVGRWSASRPSWPRERMWVVPSSACALAWGPPWFDWSPEQARSQSQARKVNIVYFRAISQKFVPGRSAAIKARQDVRATQKWKQILLTRDWNLDSVYDLHSLFSVYDSHNIELLKTVSANLK